MDGFLRVFSYWRLLLDGFLITLKLSLTVIITSTLLGVICGMLFTLKNRGIDVYKRQVHNVSIFRLLD